LLPNHGVEALENLFGIFSTGLVRSCKEALPQNVVPNVNHWIPEANAKSFGVDDRITPANAPTKTPEAPK